MKFWKNPAHIRMLLCYLVIGGAVSGLCFYTDLTLGAVAASLCVLFTVLRLTGEAAYDARVRSLSRRVRETLEGKKKPMPSEQRKGALYELDGNVYKLALKLSDCETTLHRERHENELMLRGIAVHLTERAEELPANVHRRELIALAHDLENIADLHGDPVPPERIEPSAAAEIWQDAIVLATETLRMQHIQTNVEAGARAYVTTCPRELVTHGLRGLLETCARHADVGTSWACSAKETSVFTEFRISSDRFDWGSEEFAALFTRRADAEPALVYLLWLAMLYHGEVRTEREESGMRHLIFRLYQPTR